MTAPVIDFIDLGGMGIYSRPKRPMAALRQSARTSLLHCLFSQPSLRAKPRWRGIPRGSPSVNVLPQRIAGCVWERIHQLRFRRVHPLQVEGRWIASLHWYQVQESEKDRLGNHEVRFR